MGELKALGSEKLKGDEKIQRILDLTYYQSNEVLTESSEVAKESKSGVYGVVKEKDGYYVKKGLNENSLDYIGGMFMKNKNKFSSYSEALKKMEFLTEQENLQEATKYVLKQNKPIPAPEPAPAIEPAPAPMPAEEPMAGEEGLHADDEFADEDPNDFMNVLKKIAGKLQQKLNKYKEQLESADYKEVVNQVLSAVDFDAMEEADRDEILDQIEGEDGTGEGVVPSDEFPTDASGEVPPPQETAEMDGIASLDELINTPLDEFDDTYDYQDDEDTQLDAFDDAFLNDPEIKKAGKVAKLDLDKELGDKKDEEFPLYNPKKDVDELEIPIDSTVNNVPGEPSDLDELLLDPIDSNVNDVPGERSDDGKVRELDLDELTNMVNGSVKETLGKYFE